MDRLSHLILQAIDNNSWCPIKAGRRDPPISGLLFADYLMLFIEASQSQLNTSLSILNEFCDVSRHKINSEKTSVYFYKNVTLNEKNNLAYLSVSSFKVVNEIGKYLGAQFLHTRSSKAQFKRISEKVQS